MVDRQAKITALLAQQEEERKHLFEHANRLDALEGIVGEELVSRKDFRLGYFGRVPNVSWGDSLGSNPILGKKNPTLGEVHKMARLLKPEPMVIVKGSCTSLIAEELAKDETFGTVSKIASVILKFENYGGEHNPKGTTMSWKWYTRVKGELWEVAVHCDLDTRFGSVRFKWDSSPMGRNRYLIGTEFFQPHGALTRMGKMISGEARHIKWYAGEGYANAFTIYWPKSGQYKVSAIDVMDNMTRERVQV